MALSPQYGWSEPDNSSLVKNGAADIRTLGDAIDTSLWNVGFGQAGKNKIINGNFGIWQRGTTFTPSASWANYNADRWTMYCDGSGHTPVVSRQTFTPGTAPVAGYEGQYFWRYSQAAAGTSNTTNWINQRIENVQTFAGQTITLSFWGKADAARTVTAEFYQDFGSGGSTGVTTTGGSYSFTTSWTRFSTTFAIPSISGKTIGTSSYLALQMKLPSGVAQTIDIWGVQVEYGSKATPFQTATGTLQGELAACKYYYEVCGTLYGYAFAAGTIQGLLAHAPKRVTPAVGLTTTSPYAESPISVTARTGSSSTPTGSPDPNRYGSSLIRIDGFTGMTANTISFVQSGQITLSAEL